MITMNSTPGNESETIRRTADDKKADVKLFEENLEKGAFSEWPNEAGFDGLAEQRGPIELVVKGNILAWTAGSLYRTGPGACKVEDTKSGTFHISHWFDGLAHTHKFEILAVKDDGLTDHGDVKVRVLYSSRRQAEALADSIRNAGMIKAICFGQRSDPCMGIFGRFMATFRRFERQDNVCVTVNANMSALEKAAQVATKSKTNDKDITQGHRAATKSVLLGTDTAWFCEIDPDTMEPRRYINQGYLDSKLIGAMGPAHGQLDPETGDYISFNCEFVSPLAKYQIFRISASTGETSILATIKSKPAYIHSFFMTQNHVVLCVPVSHYELFGLKMIWTGCILDAMKPFDPTECCRWYIIDQRHGKGLLAEFFSPASFFFHSTNAFEEHDSGDIICELVEYPNLNIISGLYYDVLLDREGKGKEFWRERMLKDGSSPSLVRYRFRKDDIEALAMNKQNIAPALLQPERKVLASCPYVGDMPTINTEYACLENRFVYNLTSRGFSTLFDSIAKIDTKTREVVVWAGPKGHTPSEAIFVARPRAAGAHAVADCQKQKEILDEDDGVLLSVVLDGYKKTSYLLCLDAKTMTELGRAECDFAVGFGFHGQHITAV
ncbi:carotenoid cleavage dioxygenase 1 [Pseudomassariella vexata]|uniref:Carotenoid cleavage dioxygenase 1 n=1 Tax=Pseudomassariella vexata TaxID=1141098 RepID=A0A1Y2DLH6_9PEZI|nr:carotenoid cleavage dioxygenase 1 [Pseudomassariella vexata]ORY59966.1 carotenoid cleavage dioxygenase 1 [Pseudomassariella vexata]